MYSSEDLECFYFQYQTEALPHGESVLSPLHLPHVGEGIHKIYFHIERCQKTGKTVLSNTWPSSIRRNS